MNLIMKNLLLLSAGLILSVKGHPMIIELQENEERCINLNIPEDDDAHLIFLTLPSEAEATTEWIQKYEDLEQHFLGEITKMTKLRPIPQNFETKPPDNIRKIMSELIMDWYEGETKSLAEVKIANPHTKSDVTFELHWFAPNVLNHLRRKLRYSNRDPEMDKSPLEGYEICFKSKNAEVPILLMIDHVMVSDEFEEEEDAKSGMMFKSEHLTPLQEQLDSSIRAANTVIRELNLMERREKRMRKTADSINWRVRNFSYLSVIVLILVTFFQVTYLKRYFKKKKLL